MSTLPKRIADCCTDEGASLLGLGLSCIVPNQSKHLKRLIHTSAWMLDVQGSMLDVQSSLLHRLAVACKVIWEVVDACSAACGVPLRQDIPM